MPDRIFDEQTIPFILDTIANKENVIPREIYMDYENNQAYLRVENGEDIPIGRKVIEEIVNEFIEKIRDGCSDDYNSFGKFERILKDLEEFIGRMDRLEFSRIDGLKEILLTLEGLADTDDFKALLDTKVDKVEGKGLSANDFTHVLKEKLDGIEKNANKFIHTQEPMCNITAPVESINNQIGIITLTKDDLGLSGIEDGAGPYIHPQEQQCTVKGIKSVDVIREDHKFTYSGGNYTHSIVNFSRILNNADIVLPTGRGNESPFYYLRNYKLISKSEINNPPVERYWDIKTAYDLIYSMNSAGIFDGLSNTKRVPRPIPRALCEIIITSGENKFESCQLRTDNTVAKVRRAYFLRGEIVRAEVYTTDRRYFTQVQTIGNASKYTFRFDLSAGTTFYVKLSFYGGGIESQSIYTNDIKLNTEAYINIKIAANDELYIHYNYSDRFSVNLGPIIITKGSVKYRSVGNVPFSHSPSNSYPNNAVPIRVAMERVETEASHYASVYVYTDFLTSADIRFTSFSSGLGRDGLRMGSTSLNRNSNTSLGYVSYRGSGTFSMDVLGEFTYNGTRYDIRRERVTTSNGSSITIRLMKSAYVQESSTFPPSVFLEFHTSGYTGYNMFRLNSTNAVNTEHIRISKYYQGIPITLPHYFSSSGTNNLYFVFKDINDVRLSITLYSSSGNVSPLVVNTWDIKKIGGSASDWWYKGIYRIGSSSTPTPPPPSTKRMFRVRLETNESGKIYAMLDLAKSFPAVSNPMEHRSYFTEFSYGRSNIYPVSIDEGTNVVFRVSRAPSAFAANSSYDLTAPVKLTRDNMVITHNFSGGSGGSSGSVPDASYPYVNLYIRPIGFSGHLSYDVVTDPGYGPLEGGKGPGYASYDSPLFIGKYPERYSGGPGRIQLTIRMAVTYGSRVYSTGQYNIYTFSGYGKREEFINVRESDFKYR